MAALFPQQKLLELRERAAKDAERAFVVARQAVERCRAALSEARSNLKQALSERTETAARGVVTRLGASEAFVRRRRAEVENAERADELAAAEAKKAERAFKDASLGLKAIEKLKARWEADEARRMGRRAEAALDDLATARHGRGEGGTR